VTTTATDANVAWDDDPDPWSRTQTMPDEQELESATNLAVTLAWAAGAVAIAYLVGVILTWLLARMGRRSAVLGDIAELTRMSVRVSLMVAAASIAVQRTSTAADEWRGWVDHTLLILLIAALTWLVINFVMVAERRMISVYAGGDDEITDADRRWRRIRTQVTVLRRLAIAIVAVLGVAAILTTFPSFSNIGTTVFASAGVLSVVAGLAAQTSLGAVFAGMQIAFSGAIRVGDVVELEEGRWWGRIEEITLTYVVVRLWDERRLVLPCTYFTTTPFENWTRNATEIMGAVEFDVDFSVPFHDMRAELDRLLADSEQWDGRRGVLQVTDAVGGVVRVRIVVSAPNAGALFDLRCAVREGMVDWVRRTGGLPTQRIEPTAPTTEPEYRRDGEGETPRVAASLFSGSPEADARGRAFDETRDYEDDFVKVNGRG
jgi:small-conductance mechanosensitive channel